MKQVVKKTFGPVKGFELHASIVGRGFMSTHFYHVDGTLIDTGQRYARKIVKQLVSELDIRQVVLTHYHEDHSGNAAEIKRISGAPIYGHPLTVEKLGKGFGILPYQHYMWGKSQKTELSRIPSQIICGRYKLLPIHTPGHSADHLVFYEQSEGWLFSGDLFLSPKIKYFRSDENLVDTIISLKKVLTLDFDALFCAHNPKPEKGRRMLQMKLNYLENFYGKIGRMLSKGYGERQILRRFVKSENRNIKLFTFGDVSYANMIRSAVTCICRQNCAIGAQTGQA